MDITLNTDAIRRHRTIVVVGVVLTLLLVVLSYVRVSPSGVSYRSPEVWSNQATLVLTQEGAPELRSVLPTGPQGFSSSLADTGRFAGLIDVYTTLATGDAVIDKLKRRGLLNPEDLKDGDLPISAAAVTSTVNAATPMMTVAAKSVTGPKATELTLAATKAFLDVVHARQLAAGIPVKDRIQLRVVKSSETPTLVDPRSKALPILVLLGGLIATFAVAFTRDNAARSARAVELPTVASPDEPQQATASGDPHQPDASAGVARPIPHPAATAREGTGPTSRVSRGRATLGSVPNAHSQSGIERDLPDDVPREARRR
jgi:hypothetical protein